MSANDRGKNLPQRVRSHMDEEEKLRAAMRVEGGVLIEWICGKKGIKGEKDEKGMLSLRECARRAGLSPTYVSHCRSGRSELSYEAYLRLHDVWSSAWAEYQKKNR